jgi:hypothetical protein
MNVLRDSPCAVPIVQTDVFTEVYDPPLYGIDVFAPGNLRVVLSDGSNFTKTFPTAANGGFYPYRWVAQIRRVVDTNTTISNANLIGLR